MATHLDRYAAQWGARPDEEVLDSLEHMMRRTIAYLEGIGGDAAGHAANFAKCEPSSALAAIRVLKGRHG